MNNLNDAAQAATDNPLSDEYVNAVIQRHGYQSPESVIARLQQWIGLHGGQDCVTLLMYEAHKALSKLRAPVADERAAFARSITGQDDLKPHQVQNVIDANGSRWATWRDRAALATVPLPNQLPIRLSAEVLEYLKEGIDNATQCEEADIDHDFANELGRLMQGPLFGAPLASAPVAEKAPRDVNAAMAAEYQRWIDYYHQGRDYDDFLKECVFATPQRITASVATNNTGQQLEHTNPAHASQARDA